MKNLKFKAFLKTIKKIVEVKSIHFETNHIRYNDDSTGEIKCAGFENIKLMQSTGLFDVNGKEIYEGDVLKDLSLPNNHLDVVIYNPRCQAFVLETIGVYLDACNEIVSTVTIFECSKINEYDSKLQTDRFEIVDNIYDNPKYLNN